MQENGAAPVAPARQHIPVQHDADVIKLILAHHFFISAAIGQPHRSVVVAVLRQIAPAEIWTHGKRGKPHRPDSPWSSLPPVKDRERSQHGKRRGAITFALQGARSAAPERAGQNAGTSTDKALRPLSGSGSHHDKACSAAGFGRRHFPRTFLEYSRSRVQRSGRGFHSRLIMRR